MIAIDSIPKIGLQDSIKNLESLVHGVDGTKCPRCGENNFWKGGNTKVYGVAKPRKICRNCGYAFSILDIKQDCISRNRAARTFNLDNRKVDNLIEDALQFGLIEKSGENYKSTNIGKNAALKQIQPSELYRNIPLYHYLIESLGSNPKRSDFEHALKAHPNGSLLGISKIKRDILWGRYQEIAVEIFICEKACKFGRTCKKNHIERICCDIVKEKRTKRKEWRVDVVL